MDFIKIFHNVSGDYDRMLSLYSESDVLIGSYVRQIDYSGFDWRSFDREKENLPGEFLRASFDNSREGIAAFRREVAALRLLGYVETHHTDRMLKDLKGDFTPKPDWQVALDEAIMAVLGDTREAQAEFNMKLIGTPAQDQPITRWLLALHASKTKKPNAIDLAKQARDAWMEGEATGDVGYIWSLRRADVKARIFQLLAQEYVAEGPGFDPKAGLDAIVISRQTYPSSYRQWLQAVIICNDFPELETDAYDDIYRRSHDDYFSEITSRESFKTYAVYRRADEQAGRPTWRWSSATTPAVEAEIEAVERTLGIEYPEDYRAFLKEKGECSLFVRMPDEDARLKFASPAQQLKMREDFRGFVGDGEETDLDEALSGEHDVLLRHLIPIAEPGNASNLLLMNVGPGEHYGYCYVWNHDGAWELVCAQPSFTAMKDKLLRGIVSRDAEALDLFNIHVFDDEEDEE